MKVGRITAVSVLPSPAANSMTVSANVLCVDETGVEYTFRAAYMVSDLKPYTALQEQSYQDWCKAVIALDRWRETEWYKINLEPDYRAGLTPQQTYDKHYDTGKS